MPRTIPLFGFREYLRVHLPPFKVKSSTLPFVPAAAALSCDAALPLPHNSPLPFGAFPPSRSSQLRGKLSPQPGWTFQSRLRRFFVVVALFHVAYPARRSSSSTLEKSICCISLRNMMDDTLIVTHVAREDKSICTLSLTT